MAATAPKLSLLCFILSASAAAATLTPADLILTNGRVYTDPMGGANDSLSTKITWSQAISIRDGNIQSIGTNKAVEKERGPSTKVIDLKGRVVLPGFNDSQVQVITGGLGATRVELSGVTTIAQFQDKIRAFAAANPSKKWIFGQGWDNTLFPSNMYPTKEELDAAIGDRPALLWNSDHHTALLNSRALELLRITPAMSSPRNGEIQKNSKGEPTGLLFEEAAFEAERKVNTPSFDELKAAFLNAQTLAGKYGVTSIQGGPIRGEDEVRVVEQLYTERKLTVRYAMWGELEHPQDFLALKARYKSLPDEWVKFDAVKGFVDGVLSSRTAALSEPYADDPHSRGEPLYTQERLNELVLNANRLGLPVVLHAVGDKAVAMAVTSIVAAKKQLFNSRLRNRVEQAEVTPPFVYTKFSDFNIIAGVQPSHMVYDTEAENFNETRLGPVRVKNDFAWKNFLLSNARLAFGSDWPVESLDPMLGIFGAVYRQNKNGKPLLGWNAAQKITLEQAIDAYTLGSAYATREDHVKGSLREGKYADLVVLGKDPFKAKGVELMKIPVDMTVAGGKIVFDSK